MVPRPFAAAQTSIGHRGPKGSGDKIILFSPFSRLFQRPGLSMNARRTIFETEGCEFFGRL